MHSPSHHSNDDRSLQANGMNNDNVLGFSAAAIAR